MTEQQVRFLGQGTGMESEEVVPSQVSKLLSVMVEHQRHFGVIPKSDRQWIVQNTAEAIDLFAKAVKDRDVETRWMTINDRTIVINLDSMPHRESHRPNTEHIGGGWVIVEKRNTGLYVNGRKVVFFRSLRQQQMSPGRPSGHEIRKELTGLTVLNATLLDALLANQYLIPKEWERLGDCRDLLFWGTAWYVPDDRWSWEVRSMIFHGHTDELWHERSKSLDSYLDLNYFSAILAPVSPDARPGQLIDPPPEPAEISMPVFQTWKVIKLGTHKTLDELSKALGYKVEDHARDMLKKMTLADTETEFELVKVTPRELGLGRKRDFGKRSPSRNQIYGAAMLQGLELVPAEVGPQIRLQCKEKEGSLNIAMEPIMDDKNFPRLFHISSKNATSDDGCLWTADGYPDNSQYDGPWIFTRRKKK